MLSLFCCQHAAIYPPLTHWGLVTPYGDRDLGQHRIRYWLVAWRHQAITWTNVDLSSVRPSDIHLRASPQEIPLPSITEIIWKIKYLKFNSNFPGANELKSYYYDSHYHKFVCASLLSSSPMSYKQGAQQRYRDCNQLVFSALPQTVPRS